MSTLLCDQLDPFFDGELAPEEADAFRRHLGTCAACAEGLHERMMLRVSLDMHRDALAEAGTKLPPPPPPTLALVRRLTPFIGAFAVAATVLGVVIRTKPLAPPPRSVEETSLETEATRSLEVRFAYPGADRYRPYGVERGATGAHDAVPLATLAKLEAAGDARGLAAGLALSGDLKRAAESIAKAPPSAAASVDAAAIALAAGHPEEALDRLDPVLIQEPTNAQALWDQALAMEALRLSLEAAQVWEKVAGLKEPGWSAEASQRAAHLRSAYDVHRKGWLGTIDACRALVLRGELPPHEIVAASPSVLHGCFYHALNLAPSRERVLALRPLAVSLDGPEAHGPLAAMVDREAASDLSRKAPLLERYRRLYEKGSVSDDPADDTKFLEEAKKSGDDVLFFGAVDRSYRWRDYVNELDRIATRTHDPWIRLVTARGRAKAAEAAGDYAAAVNGLRAAVADCDTHPAFEKLCAQLEYARVVILWRGYRLTEAQSAAVQALPRAEAASDDLNHTLRVALGNIAAARADFPVARAYAMDATLREPTFCAGRMDAYETSAEGYLSALDAKDAAHDLELGPRCSRTLTPLRAKEIMLLSRMGVRSAETASLAADLEAQRPVWSPARNLLGDAIAGSLKLEDDPSAEAALRETLKRAGELAASSDAQEAEERGFSALAWNAAKHADAERMTALFEPRFTLDDARCTLGLGVDYERTFGVARDAQGSPQVAAFESTHPFLAAFRAGESALPPNLLRQLRGCGEVTVLAPAPVSGTPRLLPAGVAWGYRVEGPRWQPSGERAAPKNLVVSDVETPPELSLPRLGSWAHAEPNAGVGTTWLHGSEATVPRLLAELPSATEVVVHTHGVVDVGKFDAPLLVLSPDRSGNWALTAKDVASLHLAGHPIVVLAACHVAESRTLPEEHWSLPAALVRAGARAVVASTEAIPDASAGPFFASLLARIRAGASPAVALRDERLAGKTRAAGPSGDWASSVLLFE